jgi:hypothetical protein
MKTTRCTGLREKLMMSSKKATAVLTSAQGLLHRSLSDHEGHLPVLLSP